MTARPEIIKASWERIAQYGAMIPARFYQTLFIVHPEIRQAFPVAMGKLYEHLYQTVETLVVCSGNLDDPAVEQVVHNLGRRHARRARPEHYPMVGGALLATLKHFDPEWDDETAVEWELLYRWASGVMIDAAEDLNTDPNGPDPTPRWYETYGLKRTSAYASRVMLQAIEHAVSVTPAVQLSVLGRPGWWIAAQPLRADQLDETDPQRDHDIADRSLIVVDVVISDYRSRAIALARPGTRIAVAPEVSE